tara:strand:- start:123 stop:548 length:426 start_codon:yes stop_codon:yes gene_type:complete
MFKKIFSKKNKNNSEEKNILVASLLVHAAKMDESYTDIEKEIIKRALVKLNSISLEQADDIVIKAEKKEAESNQIVEFTREIKKYSMEYRLKIIEVIWKIVYSDGITDNYETNLIRRVCGLLYVSDKDNGIVKNKVRNILK